MISHIHEILLKDDGQDIAEYDAGSHFGGRNRHNYDS